MPLLSTPDLVFEHPPIHGAPTPLLYGDTSQVYPPRLFNIAFTLAAPSIIAIVAPPVDVNIAETLPAPVIKALIAPPIKTNVAITLAAPVILCSTFYDNRVTRYVADDCDGAYQPAMQAEDGVGEAWQTSLPKFYAPTDPWQLAQFVPAQATSVHETSIPTDNAAAIPWGLTDQRVSERIAPHQPALFVTDTNGEAWQVALHDQSDLGAPHQAAIALLNEGPYSWQRAGAFDRNTLFLAGVGLRKGLTPIDMPWQTTKTADPGMYQPPVIVVVPPTHPTSKWSPHLLFQCPRATSAALLFSNYPCGVAPLPTGLLAILPARFYMAVHSIQAFRLPDNTELPIYNVSLAADRGSFAWTFSANGPDSLFDALAPSSGLPAQIKFVIDGMQWAFVVDSLQITHEFGKRGARISGRSATALVGAPYSRVSDRLNSSPMTAQQIATAALDLTGVGLDWGITDWLVPTGAWSHTGTPLAAVQAVAEAAGGYLQSHRLDPIFLVRHPYPTLPGGLPGGPWNWGSGTFSADVELAPDALITTSIERKDGPDLNGIYVSGTNQGVIALVKRSGTAGEKLGTMISDALITHADAAMQRGLWMLGQAGAKHMVQITLPVLTGTGRPGVLDVGQLVQINETTPWRGMVRAVAVDAKLPSVRQNVTIERHLA